MLKEINNKERRKGVCKRNRGDLLVGHGTAPEVCSNLSSGEQENEGADQWNKNKKIKTIICSLICLHFKVFVLHLPNNLLKLFQDCYVFPAPFLSPHFPTLKGRVALLTKITLNIKFAILINIASMKNTTNVPNFLKSQICDFLWTDFQPIFVTTGTDRQPSLVFTAKDPQPKVVATATDHQPKVWPWQQIFNQYWCISSEILMQPDVKGREIIRWSAPRSTN